MTPSVFKGLSELSEKAQTEALRDRLCDKGFKFKGKYPNQSEIKEARKQKEEEDNLDGIDATAILPDSHKRGYVCVGLHFPIITHLCMYLHTVGEKYNANTNKKPQQLKAVRKTRKKNLLYESVLLEK